MEKRINIKITTIVIKPGLTRAIQPRLHNLRGGNRVDFGEFSVDEVFHVHLYVLERRSSLLDRAFV